MPKNTFTVLINSHLVLLEECYLVAEAFTAFYRALPANEQPRARLLVVERSPEEAHLRQLVQQYQLEARTQYCRELPDVYREASVLFVPSHEQAGRVVTEAMHCGVPVLCYQHEGPGELTPAVSSLRVPSRSFAQNVADFAELLRWLHDSPALLAAEANLARRHVARLRNRERRGQQLQYA